MLAQAQPFLTVEQYLEIERASETRHEYFNGRMYAMSGASYRHVRINGNLTGELHIRLKGSSCSPLPADMRTVASGIYTYPDIVVLCGQPQFVHDQKDTLTNPTMVAEILSPSTELYDRGVKSSHYRQVPSLREYVLVSQVEPRVEVFHRHPEGNWQFSEFVGLTSTCHFQSLNCSVPLQEINAGIEFDPEEQARELIPPVE